MKQEEQKLIDDINETRLSIILQNAFDKKKENMSIILGENLEKLPEILAKIRSKKV